MQPEKLNVASCRVAGAEWRVAEREGYLMGDVAHQGAEHYYLDVSELGRLLHDDLISANDLIGKNVNLLVRLTLDHYERQTFARLMPDAVKRLGLEEVAGRAKPAPAMAPVGDDDDLPF